MPTSKHVDAILHMPPPLGDDDLVDRSKLRSMIGLIKFVRRYIPKCGLLCDPLNQLLCDESSLQWTAVHRMVLARIKDHIAFTKGVYHADFKRPLFICIGANGGSKRGTTIPGLTGARREASRHAAHYGDRLVLCLLFESDGPDCHDEGALAPHRALRCEKSVAAITFGERVFWIFSGSTYWIYSKYIRASSFSVSEFSLA